MEMKQLEYFCAIVEAGTISGAAKALHMTQPPLSYQMKMLEEELEVADNGRVPVGPYLGKFPVQAALGRPFTPLRTAPISPPEALLGCPVLCYSSSSQVCRLKLSAL